MNNLVTLRIHHSSETTELEADLSAEFEVIECLLLSMFSWPENASLLLLDYLGRELTSIQDLKEVAVMRDVGVCVECWCEDKSVLANSICTSVLLPPSTAVIQPAYSLIDTDFLLCAHCISYFDSSMVRKADANRLFCFSCSCLQAMEFGLSLVDASEYSSMVENWTTTHSIGNSENNSNSNNQSLPATLQQSPVQLYYQRYLLQSCLQLQSDSNNSMSLTAAERSIQSRILSGIQTVHVYEDPQQQAIARSVIDYEKVKYYTDQYLLMRDEVNNSNKYHPDEAFILGLMQWFKCDFFQWSNKPQCSNGHCGGPASKMTPMGGAAPTPLEQSDGWAGRVEVYSCPDCKAVTRFPRYNNPGYMCRHSRRGRCGEWANVFMLICRSLHLDASYVMDFTDHVWVEIYCPSIQRYVHADPCERSLNNPMCYEAGWNKKLSYMFAFSRFGVTDCTPRYSRKLYEVIQRRTNNTNIVNDNSKNDSIIREGVIQSIISKLDNVQLMQYQNRLMTSAVGSGGNANIVMVDPTSDRILYSLLATGKNAFDSIAYANNGNNNVNSLLPDLNLETVLVRKYQLSRELLGFRCLCVGSLKMEEMQGRISGDIQWRIDRGETNNNNASTANNNNDCSRDITSSMTSCAVLNNSKNNNRTHVKFVLPNISIRNNKTILHHAVDRHAARNYCDLNIADFGCMVQPNGINFITFDENRLLRFLTLSEWNNYIKQSVQVNWDSSDTEGSQNNANDIYASNVFRQISTICINNCYSLNLTSITGGDGDNLTRAALLMDSLSLTANYDIKNGSTGTDGKDQLMLLSAVNLTGAMSANVTTHNNAIFIANQDYKQTSSCTTNNNISTGAVVAAAAAPTTNTIATAVFKSERTLMRVVFSNRDHPPFSSSSSNGEVVVDDVIVDDLMLTEPQQISSTRPSSMATPYYSEATMQSSNINDNYTCVQYNNVQFPLYSLNSSSSNSTNKAESHFIVKGAIDNRSINNRSTVISSVIKLSYVKLGGKSHGDTVQFDTTAGCWSIIDCFCKYALRATNINSNHSDNLAEKKEACFGALTALMWSKLQLKQICFYSDHLVKGIQATYSIDLSEIITDSAPIMFTTPLFQVTDNNNNNIVESSVGVSNNSSSNKIVSVELFSGDLVDSISITTVPSSPAPSNPVPSNPVPSNTVLSNTVHSNTVPSNTVPSNTVPSNPVPSNPAPSDPVNNSITTRIGGTGGSSNGTFVVPNGTLIGFYGGFGGDIHNIGAVLLQIDQPNITTNNSNNNSNSNSNNNMLEEDVSKGATDVSMNWRQLINMEGLQSVNSILQLTSRHLQQNNCGMITTITSKSTAAQLLHNDIGRCIDLCLKVVLSNSKEVSCQCIKGIVTYTENLLKNPTEDKFRHIKTNNKYFNNNILVATGGLALFCFGPAGYQIDNSSNSKLQLLQCTVTIKSADNILGLARLSDWKRYLSIYVDYLKSFGEFVRTHDLH